MARTRRKIGEILQRFSRNQDGQPRLTDEHLKEGLTIASNSRKRIGEALVDLGYVSSNEVAKALATQHEMEFVDLDQPNVIKKENLDLIPPDLMKKYLVLPLGGEGKRIKVLVHDPMDLALIDDLRFRLGKDIDLALGAKSKIKEYIEHRFSETAASIDETVRELSMDRGESIDMELEGGDPEAESMKDEAKAAQQAPIIRLVNNIIKEAVITRASDIHIEPFEDRVRLRYRIDGVCHERDTIPKRTQGSVIARLKIISGMKIEEKRIPQDGRIKMRINDKVTDFRVSACPAVHGESIVLRILRSEAASLGLEKLGMQPDTLELFEKVISKPTGIFLVTGPTGSGKTTTLYSALQVLNKPDLKIITAEDPIEYNFKGINQCQVNESIGLGFPTILRSMLRQAPNVILVGEIRDKAVGEVAVQAALTGHLVFSTLHTNDAPSSMTRLIDMGIKPFLVASSVQAVLAQRLVRILCDDCKQPVERPNRRLMQLLGFSRGDLENHTIYEPNGCNRCSGTGFRGRQGIYELMIMNSEIRELAFNRAPVNKIRKAALAGGMRDLLGDGKLKILEGKTTLEEVSKIAQVEGVVEMVDEEAEEDELVAV